jgi:hypothetical protein
MIKKHLFLIVNTIVSIVAIFLLKLHDLTAFHTFMSFLMFIIINLVLLEKYDTEKNKFNVFYSLSVFFYIVYSVFSKEIHITNSIFTNLISVNLCLISLGVSIMRTRISTAFQEKITLVYFVVLCFPINILQNNEIILLVLRQLIFFLLYNLELYLGLKLNYKTNLKQLFLVSFFVNVVDIWYTVVSIPIVLSHFAHIKLIKEEEQEEEEEQISEKKKFIIKNKKNKNALKINLFNNV